MKNKADRKNITPASLKRFNRARVLVVGDVIHDVFIWGEVKRISPEAPVPVVEVTNQTSMLGGAANVVNNVMALGASASLAGVVGKDHAGEEVIGGLTAIGADASLVIKSVHRPTPVKTRIIARKQQVVRFDREEARPLRPQTEKALWSATRKGLDRADAVIVSDYAKGAIGEDLMKKLVKLCRRKGKPIAVDPKPAHAQWYKGVTVITPNNKEASEMAGFEITDKKDLDRAGRALLKKLECDSLLITRGDKGMSLFRTGRPALHVPALAREVYDVTGAGDTVIGVLTVAMASGMDMENAVKTANLAAGVVVAKVGASVATIKEIAAALKENGGLLP